MEAIAQDESVSRFILFSDHYTSTRVKPEAFMPHPKRFDLSVFRIDRLNESQIWRIGQEEVAAKMKRTLHARADTMVCNFIKEGLSVESSEPPPLHADVKGWPKEKSAQKLLARKIANEAKLLLNFTENESQSP